VESCFGVEAVKTLMSMVLGVATLLGRSVTLRLVETTAGEEDTVVMRPLAASELGAEAEEKTELSIVSVVVSKMSRRQPTSCLSE
jgi:hypothetical protein